MLSAAVGAIVVLLVSIALNWPTTQRTSSSVVGGSTQQDGAASAPIQSFDSSPGSCLDWTKPDATDIRKVPCEQPHLFEVTGKADLESQFDSDAPYPRPQQWQALKQKHCSVVSGRYLAGRFDPAGRFSVGAFTPSNDGWLDGDRTVHCGLQQPGPSGKLYRMTGHISTLDQSNVYTTGRCLGINGKAVWDPVDCAEQHSVEITGEVNLGEQFPNGYPAETEQDNFLAIRCAEITARYAGSPTAASDKGLITYWDTLTAESWHAGSRMVNCKVSAQLPDGSALAPVTGSVTGPVTIAPGPAAENLVPIEPGVPATGER